MEEALKVNVSWLLSRESFDGVKATEFDADTMKEMEVEAFNHWLPAVMVKINKSLETEVWPSHAIESANSISNKVQEMVGHEVDWEAAEADRILKREKEIASVRRLYELGRAKSDEHSLGRGGREM